VTAQQQKEIFEQWLNTHQALIFKVVRAYARDVMDQDDLFQEIAIQVWNSVPAFRQESSVTTWLYRISLNIAIKWTGKERRHQGSRESLENVAPVLQEKKVQRDERLDWLYDEISRMDEIDRSITLLLLEDFSYREMATITGITESNIGVRINRIKKYLINRSKKI
jgi:RNA polymerase sigma-70 factor, ECF subfamily